jgi:AcrR family transcriptional regulator
MGQKLAEALPRVRLSRKERELQFRVNLVLDAAEEVFGQSSYAQASVEEIARRAEISVGTLCNLFHSKEDIYRGVISRAQDLFFKNLEQRIDSARGPNEKIHAIVRYFFEHFSKYSRQFRHYVSATNGFQWELKSKLEQDAFEAQQSFMRRLVEICQRGMDEGIFKKGLPAELMAVTLLGVPHSFLMVWLEQEGVDVMSLVPPALIVSDRVTGAGET